MVFGVIIGVVVLVAGFTAAIRRAFGRPTPLERVLRAEQAAAGQVDDLFAGARIRMEEAAGRRQPGEQRIEDGWGSWNRW